MEYELVEIFFGVFTSVILYDPCGEEDIPDPDSSILLADLVVKLIVIILGERDRLTCENSSRSSASLFAVKIRNFLSASRAYLFRVLWCIRVVENVSNIT